MRMTWLAGLQLFSSGTTSKNPLNAVLIVELAVKAERHFVELLEPRIVLSIFEFIKNRLQLIIRLACYKNCKGISLYGLKFRRGHPVCSREFNVTAFEMGVNYPPVFLWRELLLHGRIAKLSDC